MFTLSWARIYSTFRTSSLWLASSGGKTGVSLSTGLKHQFCLNRLSVGFSIYKPIMICYFLFLKKESDPRLPTINFDLPVGQERNSRTDDNCSVNILIFLVVFANLLRQFSSRIFVFLFASLNLLRRFQHIRAHATLCGASSDLAFVLLWLQHLSLDE